MSETLVSFSSLSTVLSQSGSCVGTQGDQVIQIAAGHRRYAWVVKQVLGGRPQPQPQHWADKLGALALAEIWILPYTGLDTWGPPPSRVLVSSSVWVCVIYPCFGSECVTPPCFFSPSNSICCSPVGPRLAFLLFFSYLVPKTLTLCVHFVWFMLCTGYHIAYVPLYLSCTGLHLVFVTSRHRVRRPRLASSFTISQWFHLPLCYSPPFPFGLHNLG